MDNPVVVEVLRGEMVESRHRGAFAVANADGRLTAHAGNVDSAIYPRSAIKALQALPLIETGAADRFGFTDEEIALACSSHGGEPEHVATARSMLAKAGIDESHLECGAHWPSFGKAARALAKTAQAPSRIHNNCSGKHAGMLAVARHMNEPLAGYIRPDHPVQRRVRETMERVCGVDLSSAACGTDGCSIPTWAIPLRDLAAGFARFGAGHVDEPRDSRASQRIIEAVRAAPFMVAGSGRLCTTLMSEVPRAFVKTGAEGVFCACVPHAGLGIALKCDDGTTRAAEAMLAAVLARLDVWDGEERESLSGFETAPVNDRNGSPVGQIRPVASVFDRVLIR